MNLINDTITSRQNPKIKNVLSLHKYSERIRQNIILIEGIKEIEKAIKADYKFETVFFNPGLIVPEKITKLFGLQLPKQLIEVNEHVFNKISYRENSGGLIVLAKAKSYEIQSLTLSENPLLLVIEGVEKPGNLGAIYRTAEAAGIDGIILCDSRTDLYNPNAIRASLGCVFTVPTTITTSTDAIEWLKDRGIRIFCTYLKAAVPYHSIDFTKPSAIVMGTETTGISKVWLDTSDTNIIIPMQGTADSMNVSASAAVIIFEACRQRNYL